MNKTVNIFPRKNKRPISLRKSSVSDLESNYETSFHISNPVSISNDDNQTENIPLESNPSETFKNNKKLHTMSEDFNDSISERLDAIKLIQKMRRQNRGLDAKAVLREEDNEELEEPEEESTYGLLERQFTSKSDNNPVQRDKDLEEFLLKRLNPTTQEITESNDLKDRENELYQVPERLKVKDSLSDQADKMNWVTGLVEVPLPIDLKIKNIEATEKVKRKFLKLGKSDTDKGEKERIDSIIKTAFGSRFQNVENERFVSKSKASNDDAAVDRFRRNFIRRQSKQ